MIAGHPQGIRPLDEQLGVGSASKHTAILGTDGGVAEISANVPGYWFDTQQIENTVTMIGTFDNLFKLPQNSFVTIYTIPSLACRIAYPTLGSLFDQLENARAPSLVGQRRKDGGFFVQDGRVRIDFFLLRGLHGRVGESHRVCQQHL